MSTPEQRLAELLADWRDAERDLWLLRHVEVEEAARRAEEARRAYEHARQEPATQMDVRGGRPAPQGQTRGA